MADLYSEQYQFAEESMLKNKTIFLTGVTGGIGEHIAEYLLSRGANLGLPFRDAGKAARLEKRWHADKKRIIFIQSDFAGSAAYEAGVQKTLQRFGAIHGAVHSIGGFASGTVAETPDALWHRQLEINLNQAFYFSKALLPVLRNQGGGSLVFIGSIIIGRPQKGTAAYTVAKNALAVLVQTIAEERRGEGIRANLVAPGLVATPDNIAAIKGDPGQWVQPEAIARQVAFLLSEESAPASGCVIWLPEA